MALECKCHLDENRHAIWTSTINNFSCMKPSRSAADLHRSTSCDLAAQGSSRCSSGNLIAAHQRNRAVLLLVVEEERTVRKPADKVIAPVLLDNPVLSHVGSYQKLGYCINFTVSISPSFYQSAFFQLRR